MFFLKKKLHVQSISKPGKHDPNRYLLPMTAPLFGDESFDPMLEAVWEASLNPTVAVGPLPSSVCHMNCSRPIGVCPQSDSRRRDLRGLSIVSTCLFHMLQWPQALWNEV